MSVPAGLGCAKGGSGRWKKPMSLARSKLSRWPIRPNFVEGRGPTAGIGSKSEPTLLVRSPPTTTGVPVARLIVLTLPTFGEATPPNRSVRSMAVLTGKTIPASEVLRLCP